MSKIVDYFKSDAGKVATRGAILGAAVVVADILVPSVILGLAVSGGVTYVGGHVNKVLKERAESRTGRNLDGHNKNGFRVGTALALGSRLAYRVLKR